MTNISVERISHLERFQQKIKYSFNKPELLNIALTHSSYANECKKQKIKHNERLEFLGDSVLGVVVSDYIFNKFPNYPEGELTKLRATIVCEPSLGAAAQQLELGKYLLLGKGEEITGGRNRISILSDTFEAVIGAIYLDGKLNKSKEFILDNLTDIIHKAVEGSLFIDYKTELQEILQKTTKNKIKYIVIDEEGPDHNKTFYVAVKVGDKLLGEGNGKSKKEAEQESAKTALNKMGVFNE